MKFQELIKLLEGATRLISKYKYITKNGNVVEAELHDDDKAYVDEGGFAHRDNGPAVMTYMDELPFMYFWFSHGKLHRLDGPATIDYYEDIQEYWVEGKRYSKEEFEDITKSVDADNIRDIIDIGELF